jgi:tetratricopeptide (TPR) repeat protein
LYTLSYAGRTLIQIIPFLSPEEMPMPAALAVRIQAFLAIACAVIALMANLGAGNRVAAAPKPGLYDDPRLVTWSKAYLEGRRGEVLADVERDLRSESPHPFSPRIWSLVHTAQDNLKASWEAVADPALRAALASDPEIFQMFTDGEFKRMLQVYPPSRASEIRSIWGLDSLAWAAINQSREVDALEYMRAAARIRSDHFQIAWVVAVDIIPSESARPRVAALVKPGGEWAGTLLGRFLANELEFLPTDAGEDEQDRVAMEAWLREQPADAAAMRRMAVILKVLGRSDEAIALALKTNDVYPFRFRFYDPTVNLIAARKVDEARRVLTRMVAVSSSDEAAAAALVEFWMASGLKDAGERDAAIQVADNALAKWPDDAKLVNLRAGLALDNNSLAEAVAYSKKAVTLKPENLAYQERYLEILRRAGYVDEGLAHFTELEKRLNQKSRGFFEQGLRLYSVGESTRAEWVALARRAVAEYPGSAQMHNELAHALATAGQTKEALEELERSFNIEYPSTWAIKRYAGLVGEAGGPQGALAAIDGLIARYPWLDRLAKHAPGAAPSVRPFDEHRGSRGLARRPVRRHRRSRQHGAGLGGAIGQGDPQTRVGRRIRGRGRLHTRWPQDPVGRLGRRRARLESRFRSARHADSDRDADSCDRRVARRPVSAGR